METDANFLLAGSENCEEYPADFYPDRNYDCSVAGEWFYRIYCLRRRSCCWHHFSCVLWYLF